MFNADALSSATMSDVCDDCGCLCHAEHVQRPVSANAEASAAAAAHNAERGHAGRGGRAADGAAGEAVQPCSVLTEVVVLLTVLHCEAIPMQHLSDLHVRQPRRGLVAVQWRTPTSRTRAVFHLRWGWHGPRVLSLPTCVC